MEREVDNAFVRSLGYNYMDICIVRCTRDENQ